MAGAAPVSGAVQMVSAAPSSDAASPVYVHRDEYQPLGMKLSLLQTKLVGEAKHTGFITTCIVAIVAVISLGVCIEINRRKWQER